MDHSPPCSSVHGISQARKLEWVTISFSRGISPTQGWNLGLLHWQADSSHLTHLGSPIAPNGMKSPWCWERLRAGGEGDDRAWDGRMALPSQRTWVWASSRNWWWTGKPGVLQSVGSQRVARDWEAEQRQEQRVTWVDIVKSTPHLLNRKINTEWGQEGRPDGGKEGCKDGKEGRGENEGKKEKKKERRQRRNKKVNKPTRRKQKKRKSRGTSFWQNVKQDFTHYFGGYK